jgi:hypothetical protein
MAGPSIQQPSSLSQMFDVVTDEKGKLVSLSLKPEWASFFQAMQQTAIAASRNGSTTSRPTEDFKGRYEGMPFFDRTLGFPVFLKHASSNVWVRYDGTVV